MSDAELPTLPSSHPGSGDANVGARFGRFIVVGVLGRGGMGVVLRARDGELDREVAIKVLTPERLGEQDSTGAQRLQLEAQAMAKLTHPNVVRVFDIGHQDGARYIVMELVEGTTLRRWLASAKRTPQAVIEAFVACGRGLAAAHAAGLVHRDFKPENVLVDSDGRPQVTDFGLVAAGRRVDGDALAGSGVSRGLTVDGAILGTPAYMAPEQWRAGDTDARSDQFAFCIALWEALYGERPFAGNTPGELKANVLRGAMREPPADKDVPGHIRASLRRGLAIERGARWPSMNALLAALERPRGARWPIALAAGAGVAAVAAVWIATRPSPAAACPDPAPRLAGVWDASTAARMKAAFVAASPATGADTATRLIARLDDYAEAWRAASLASCKSTDTKRLDERTVCLDRRLAELRNLTGALVAADRDDVNGAIDTAGALTSIDTCADEASLRAFAMPTDPGMRRRVVEIDREIDAAARLKYGDQPAAHQAKAAAALAAAREVGYPPLLLRALEEMFQAASANSDLPTSNAIARELAQKAAEGQDDTRAAIAWIQLLHTLTKEHERDEAKAIEPVAEAAVVRAGSPPMLRHRLLVARATRLFYASELDASVTAYEDAIAVAPPEMALIETRILLAQAIEKRDGAKAALPLIERALADAEKKYGPTHPSVADGLDLMARFVGDTGDLEKAFALQTRVLAIREAALAPGHREIGMTLSHLATTQARRRNVADARDLYVRAISLLEAANRPADAAMTQTMLGGLLADHEGIEKGRPHFEAGLRGLAATFGDDSVQYAQMEMNYAQRLIDADLCPQAQPHIDHLVGVFERKDPRNLALVLSAVFVCDEKAKRWDAAIDKLTLARTSCAAQSCDFPEELAFDLGLMLHDSGRDRARGRALIDEAAKLAKDNGATEMLAEIQAWKRAHR
ncbi:MAG TPA: serine/threonine-protein kinase [Kofleriaceae bacterium]|nr:serine/threonine-protein kinase [Kofleriaceae bacterium]